MSRQMWIGTRNYEQWVPMPNVDSDITKVGWNTKSQLLNGGAWVRRSKAGHREYQFVWAPTKTRDELRPIMDLADGVYDVSDGTNLVYFLTADSMDKNAAPQGWAFPGQEDAMPLVVGSIPDLSATPANALGYPARSATYTTTDSITPAKVYIPIPPGYTAWVGVHGTATGSAAFNITPYASSVSGTVTEATLLSVTSTTRVNASFDSTSYTGLELAIKAAAGTITLSGIIVQVLKIGVTPSTGGYISGYGHSGCQFESLPTPSYYTITPTLEATGMTTKLVEVGSWL